MSEHLPYGGFEWLKNVDEFDVNPINETSEIGYFLEVDLKYPDKLHELHNDYPLQKNLLFLVIYCQNTVKFILINME